MFALVELTVVGGSFIILPWAVSAFIAAILAFYDVAIEIQWAIFVFGGAVLFAFLYRWAQRFMKEHTMAPGVGADRLVGLTAIVTAADRSRRHRPQAAASRSTARCGVSPTGRVTHSPTGAQGPRRRHEGHPRRGRRPVAVRTPDRPDPATGGEEQS